MAFDMAAELKELCHGPHHAVLLVVCQFGIHRQRQSLVRGAFGVRKVARLVVEIAGSFLQVKRHWIINVGANPLRLEM